jgi:hypothetical protein
LEIFDYVSHDAGDLLVNLFLLTIEESWLVSASGVEPRALENLIHLFNAQT